MKIKLLFLLPLLILCHDNSDISSELSLLESHGAFLGSFLAIIFSELGDKTFIIAAILAMKYSRNWVFIGSAGAMLVMTFVSCFLGQFILYILPEFYMKLGAALLFFAFGIKALYEGVVDQKSDNEEEEIEKEMEILNQKLEQTSNCSNMKDDNNNSKAKNNKLVAVAGHIVATQTFLQIFLGEWGDRSQISTIAMSASYDSFKVFLGSFIAHAVCSAIAVTGGRYVANYISERLLTIFGGALFVIFGLITVYNL